MIIMNRKLLAVCCRVVLLVVIVSAVLAPAVAFGQRRNEPEKEIIDARLEGYPSNVTLPGAGTSLTYILLIIFGALVFAGMFKDAKRSHLD
jgi:hypothetical protein